MLLKPSEVAIVHMIGPGLGKEIAGLCPARRCFSPSARAPRACSTKWRVEFACAMAAR